MNNKVLGKWLFYAFLLAIASFTAWRSWHLLQLTFAPREQGAVTFMQLIVPWLGLAVFDGGCVAWAFWYRSNARGSVPRTIAFVGSALDGLGAIMASGFDTFIGGQQLTAVSPDAGFYALLLVVVFTGLNAAFVWGVHMFDPEAVEESDEQDVADAIRDAARKIIKREKEKYARLYAPTLAQEIMDRGRIHVARSGNGSTPEHMFDALPDEPQADNWLLAKLRAALAPKSDNGHELATDAPAAPTLTDPNV